MKLGIGTMEPNTTIIPIILDNGSLLRVEATVMQPLVADALANYGEEIETDVALTIPTLKEIAGAIEGIATTLKTTFDKIKPNKASVEFGVEFGCEAGQLTAMIVKGTSKANLKITLQYENQVPAKS
jgi:Trypsin-co-occurring domain 1